MIKNKDKGFSLIELVIVVAIMAVLIAVLAPQFIRYIEKSKQGKDVISRMDRAGEASPVTGYGLIRMMLTQNRYEAGSIARSPLARDVTF